LEDVPVEIAELPSFGLGRLLGWIPLLLSVPGDESTERRPNFEPNPAHTPGSPGFNRDKTIEPPDSAEIFKSAIQGKDGNWYGKSGDQIYRYFPDNAGAAHFSGMTGGDKGIPPDRIPIGVRRVFDWRR
jgi:hypothetical protein